MPGEVKNIAIIGANKDGLNLLPLLVSDPRSRIVMIADSNPDAMLFKLRELGYRLSERLGIEATTDIEKLKGLSGLDIVINALQDEATGRFLESPEFRDVEKLGPLSTRLIWGVRVCAPAGGGGAGGMDDQNSLLASLREIVDAVRLTIDRKELLSVILKLAIESTGAERGSIMLLSDEGTLRVEIAKGMDEEVVRKIRVPLGDGVSGKVAAEGKPMLISGKTDGTRFSRAMDRSDVKSAMCVPLLVHGEVIGVVNVNSSESKHSFTEKDLTFLSSLSSLAAEVIQRSNEYEKLRVDSAKFTFWKEIDGIMGTKLPLDKRLNQVATRLAGIVPGLTCFIYIYDEERDRLMLSTASIRDARRMGMLSLRSGEGMEGAGLEAMRDVVLVDRAEEEGPRRVYLSLPMRSHGQVVGTFNAQVVSPHGLSKHHEAFLKEIRTLIAESVYKFKEKESETQRSRKMFAVDEAGLEMISVREPRRLATIIATTPAAIIGAEGSLLRLLQKEAKRYRTVATYGLDDKEVREYFLPIEKESVMEALRKKSPVERVFAEEASPYIRSVLTRPLVVEDEIVGVLTLFNKTSEGAFFPCGFSKIDNDVLARFSVYAEKALANMDEAAAGPLKKAEVKQSPMFLFEKRVEEELNRARRIDKGLVLATVRITGLKEAFAERKEELENRLMSVIRKKTRSFDVSIRLNEETFGFLFLDTSEKVTRLIGTLTEVIDTDAALSRAYKEGQADVLYGYATFPRDGDSFAELFSVASDRTRLNLSR